MATSSGDGWGPCPNGTFVKLAGRLSARRKRSLAFTILGGIAAVLVTGVTATAVTQHIVDSISTSNHSGCCPSPPPSTCSPSQPAPVAVPAK
jgi:hypothetical protein